MKHLKLIILCVLSFAILISCVNRENYTLKYEIPISNKELPELYLERSGYTVSFNTETNIPNWLSKDSSFP